MSVGRSAAVALGPASAATCAPVASAGELPRIHGRLRRALHQPLLTPQAGCPLGRLGCPRLRPASANQPLGPRWPLIPALLPTQAGNYENEIEGILRDASERVRRFHAACEHKHDNARLEARAEEIEARYEKQRVRALKEIEAFKKRTGAQQAPLASAHTAPPPHWLPHAPHPRQPHHAHSSSAQAAGAQAGGGGQPYP